MHQGKAGLAADGVHCASAIVMTHTGRTSAGSGNLPPASTTDALSATASPVVTTWSMPCMSYTVRLFAELAGTLCFSDMTFRAL
jgi:hypothetical protein